MTSEDCDDGVAADMISGVRTSPVEKILKLFSMNRESSTK
jgi:hypothetical protein